MILGKSAFFKNYSNILLLLVGIMIGSLFGLFAKGSIIYLKPIGDIFLNLLFTVIIPLIFFAIASAVANIEQGKKLGNILSIMALVFLGTVIVAAITMILSIWLFPLQEGIYLTNIEEINVPSETESWSDNIVQLLTVNEFNLILSRQHMLAFIIFSFIIGISALRAGEKGVHFRMFLNSGNEIMKIALTMIMKLAPVGLGAYFAYQVGTVGPQLFGIYAKPMGLFYGTGIVYFFVAFSFYAYLAYGKLGVKLFWKNEITPAATAISTCSSIAVIPVNLISAKKIGVQDSIANIVIPLGANLHKDGSSLSSIVKIAVAFAVIGRDFMEPATILSAIGITVIVSIVAGGIPNGGYIGELLMISIYDLPTEAIPAVMIIGTLVDPLATVLNSNGDTVAAMLVNRLTGNKLIPQAEIIS